MRARRGAALLLVVPALVLGAAACGGQSAKTTTSKARVRAAEAHWRTGLFRWRRSMLVALDGISELFSSQVDLQLLEERHSAASDRLVLYEATLSGCGDALHRLGPVPLAFQLSGQYASQACRDLEQGSRLVREAVYGLVHNTLTDPLNPLTDASTPLGSGQSEVGTAAKALDLPKAVAAADA